MQGQSDDKLDSVGIDVIQYFNNLNWFAVDKEEEKDCARAFLPDKEKYGVKNNVYNLINKVTAPFLHKVVPIPPLKEDEEEPQGKYIPGLDSKYEILYPERSNLTWGDQKMLYSFLVKNTFDPASLGEKKRIQFQELLLKAKDDYAVFQSYVRSQWILHHCARVKQIPPQVSEYIEHVWNVRARECLTLYPDRYKLVGNIALSLNDPNDDFAVMDFMKKVYNVGRPHTMFMPSHMERKDLISDYSTLCKIKSIDPTHMSDTKAASMKLLPVSLDPNVGRALETNDIDVVMAKSAVKALVAGYLSHKEWMLPITVKTVYNVHRVAKKVVIIGKKLPPSSMSVHDKNVWHAKLVSKWVLILQSNPNIFENKTTAWNSAKRQNEQAIIDLTEETKTLDTNTESETIEKHIGTQSVSAKKLQNAGNKNNEQNRLKTPISFSQNPQTSVSSAKEQSELGLSDLTKKIKKLDCNTGNKLKTPISFSQNPQTSVSSAKGQNEQTIIDLTEETKTLDTNTESETIEKHIGIQSVSAKKLQNAGNKNNEQKRLKTPISFSQNPQTSVSSKERTLTEYDTFTFEDVEEFGVDPVYGGVKEKKAKLMKTDSNVEKSNVKLDSLIPENEKHKMLIDEAVISSNELTLKNQTITGLKRKSSAHTSPETPVPHKISPQITPRAHMPPRSRGWCVEYTLWNLHKSRHFRMAKHEQRSLKVFIRHKVDGLLTYYRNRKRYESLVCVSSKIEFQPEYGASKLEVKDLLREYVDLFLKKEAMLVRLRSIGHTKELMLTEIKSMSDIKNHLQVEKVPVCRIFDPMYAVLTRLTDLPVGKYMLHYNTKMGAFGELLLASDDGTSLILPNYLQSLHQADVSVPAFKIDPSTLTGIHYLNKLPPALFKPCYNVSFPCMLTKVPLKVQRRRKKKPKKKAACSSICT